MKHCASFSTWTQLLFAGRHAHLILGFAGRSSIVLHACLLLIGADLATRLGTGAVEARERTSQHQKRDGKNTHVNCPPVEPQLFVLAVLSSA